MAALSDINPQGYNDKDLAEPVPTHEFSSPWDDSDLVLIVEEQKLHVHSIILKMASPVFKTMLSSDFKEKNEKEISLPWKKADEFVDLLRQVYPQFSSYKIQLSNIEHIYQLADEYQIERVCDGCRKALECLTVTTRNLSTMLVLTQKLNSDGARKKCYKILSKMTVDELTRSKGFGSMDEQSLRDVLVPKAQRLEECLTKIQPQVVGLMDCVMYLWLHPNNTKCVMEGKPTECSAHMGSFFKTSANITTRLKCGACVQGFKEMATRSFKTISLNYSGKTSKNYHYSSSGMYFDENIVKLLQEMFDLLQTK